MKRVQRGDQGFTLLEMFVVIIIIGILTAIAIPVFLDNRQSWRELQTKVILEAYYPKATVTDQERLPNADGKVRMSGLVDFGETSKECVFTLNPGNTMECEGILRTPDSVSTPSTAPTSTPDPSATAEPVPTVTVTQTVTAPAS